MHKQPFRYLDLDNGALIDTWKNAVPSFSDVFIKTDYNCSLVKENLLDFFVAHGLKPKLGHLWSWNPGMCPPYYHTDHKPQLGLKPLEVAINWLVYGDPGKTEWSYQALDYKIDMGEKTNPYKTPSQWWGNAELAPDFSIQLTKPTLLNINVPHRVNTLDSTGFRISYSIRFQENPSFDEACEKLKNFII